MSQTISGKSWLKPELVRLGTIADVSGQQTTKVEAFGCALRSNGKKTCTS